MKKFIIEKKESEIIDDVMANLEPEFDKLLSAMDDEFEKIGESVNEEILTAAAIAIALPATMKLVSTIGKASGKIITRIIGKKPTDDNAYQRWMDELGTIADKLHHLYLKPIEKLIGKFVKDKTKANKIANAILHIIVAGFLVASGVAAMNYFKSSKLSMAALETALATIKGGEITSYISKLFA